MIIEEKIEIYKMKKTYESRLKEAGYKISTTESGNLQAEKNGTVYVGSSWYRLYSKVFAVVPKPIEK